MRLHFGQGRIRGDVGESSISKVYENRIGLLVDGRLKQFDTVVDVRVRSKQIFPAIVVEIEETRRMLQ